MQKHTKTEFEEQNKTRTKYNSRLKTSIQFTKPMQIELLQLLQMMFTVKFYSNALEKVQSNQSLNCLKSQIRVNNHPSNM